MWHKSEKQSGLCAQYCAMLEDLRAGAGETEASAELRKSLPAGLIAHAGECSSCREATKTFWASRNLLAGPFQEMRKERAGLDGAAPWFAKQVMAKIAEREMQGRRATTEWSGAVSKLAARLAWVSALMLLVGSTWLYNPQTNGPQSNGPQSNGGQSSTSAGPSPTETAPQYLFDSATAPSNVDDALVSPAER